MRLLHGRTGTPELVANEDSLPRRPSRQEAALLSWLAIFFLSVGLPNPGLYEIQKMPFPLSSHVANLPPSPSPSFLYTHENVISCALLVTLYLVGCCSKSRLFSITYCVTTVFISLGSNQPGSPFPWPLLAGPSGLCSPAPLAFTSHSCLRTSRRPFLRPLPLLANPLAFVSRAVSNQLHTFEDFFTPSSRRGFLS